MAHHAPVVSETHYHDADRGVSEDSSPLTMVVLLFAVLFILGLAFFAFRSASFGTFGAADRGTNIDVSIPAPDVNVPAPGAGANAQ